MSRRIITKHRVIDAWGVEAAKVAPWIAKQAPGNNNPRKWLLQPIHIMLPGHDWAQDEEFLRLTHAMSGEEIEFAKAWLNFPENKSDAVREIFPQRLVKREEHRRACNLSKKPSVIDLRDYLLGLHINERRRTDRLRVTPEQIMCELENLFLDTVGDRSELGKKRTERLGKFLWGVRTGCWGQMKLLHPIAKEPPFGRDEVGAVIEAGGDAGYSEGALADFLEGYANSDEGSDGGRGGIREPVQRAESEAPD